MCVCVCVCAGGRAGYLFQIGDFGVGYYKDNPPIGIVTAESLEQEQLELRVKVRQLRTHDACPSLHPTKCTYASPQMAKTTRTHVSADLGRTT